MSNYKSGSGSLNQTMLYQTDNYLSQESHAELKMTENTALKLMQSDYTSGDF